MILADFFCIIYTMVKKTIYLVLILLLIATAVFAKRRKAARRSDIEPIRQLIFRERFEDALDLISPLELSDPLLWQRGYALLGLNRFSEALDAFEELSPSPYRDYAICLCYEGMNRAEKAIEILSAADFPPPLDRKGDNLLYRLLRDIDDYPRAREQIQRLRDLYPEHYSRRWTEVERLEIEIAQGDDAAALQTFDHIMRNRADQHAMNAARLMEDRIKSPDRVLALAETFYNRKAYGDALKQYQRYIETESGRADGKAHYRIARSNDRLGRYSKALDLYRELASKKLFNDGWAAYGEIRCLRKLKRYDEALAVLEKTEPEWKSTSAAPYVKWEGYEIGRETKDYLLAGKWASRLADDHPTHEYGDNAFVLAGIFFHLGGDEPAARKYFNKIDNSGYFSSESFKNIGRYWSARTGGGLVPESDDLPDFYTYHHEKGINRLNVPSSPGQKPTKTDLKPLLSAAGFDSTPLDTTDAHYLWGRFFAKIGIYRWASWEYEEFLAENTGMHRTTAALDLIDEFSELGLTNLAYELGLDVAAHYRVNSKDVPDGILMLEYPVFFTDRLWDLGSEYAIDPLFVLSVMRQESRFDIKATSWADARGLMQVIPSTGSTIARELSISDFRTEDLYDPEISQLFGTYLLSKLIRRTGSPYTALAAYNAGETPLSRWQDFPGAEDDMLLFTELVDYGETRRYIRKVMENYIRYSELYIKE